MTYKLIYVCYANKGRSPAFEAYTRDFLRRKYVSDIEVVSAGVGLAKIEQLRREHHGLPSRLTRQILHGQGLDMDSHQINFLGDVVSRANLILAVDQHTLDMVQDNFHNYSDRAMLVGDYAGTKKYREVHGPHHECRGKIKSEHDGYVQMIAEIRRISRKVVKRLIRDRKK